MPADATFAAPKILNPVKALKLNLTDVIFHFQSNSITIHYQLLDADDNVVDTNSKHVTAADHTQLATYMDNQKATITARVAAKLGVTLA